MVKVKCYVRPFLEQPQKLLLLYRQNWRRASCGDWVDGCYVHRLRHRDVLRMSLEELRERLRVFPC